MQTISVRVPDEDLEWLMALDIAGARNPSDRIRSLLSTTRRQREGMADYVACVAMLRDFVAPLPGCLECIRAQAQDALRGRGGDLRKSA